MRRVEAAGRLCGMNLRLSVNKRHSYLRCNDYLSRFSRRNLSPKIGVKKNAAFIEFLKCGHAFSLSEIVDGLTVADMANAQEQRPAHINRLAIGKMFRPALFQPDFSHSMTRNHGARR